MNVKRIAKVLEEKDDLRIRNLILEGAREKSQIVHGSRAYNIQSPYYLRKKTSDYDLLAYKPKKSAEELAKELRRVLHKDVEVTKGKHKGTYKVKMNGKTIADYTQLKTKPKTKSSFGTKVRDIKSIKRNVQRLTKKPTAKYRREKDLDTLQRIEKIEALDKRFSL